MTSSDTPNSINNPTLQHTMDNIDNLDNVNLEEASKGLDGIDDFGSYSGANTGNLTGGEYPGDDHAFLKKMGKKKKRVKNA